MYTVTRIDDPDFGCEGLQDGETAMAVIYLSDGCTNQKVIEISDALLYSKNINVGDKVTLQNGKLTKIEK